MASGAYEQIREQTLPGSLEVGDVLSRYRCIREATYEVFVTEGETNEFMELDDGPKVQVLRPAAPRERTSFPPRAASFGVRSGQSDSGRTGPDI